ncbi:glycogen debranching N-terminal domain-containing protein [Streptomyces sp. RKND-216]|uniref:amylo-alpha-1,6-glucosidase n=1 Tax=Streptomyces sp. RKND-216 TaxID=2562581 RepID=UPI001FF71DEF|nr:glycogen debranching N-terminal domain-containing protein [Streptomyces sp. RKND-216]
MIPDSRLLVHDGTFAVLDAAGDVTGRSGVSPDGLFLQDGRHLSRWRLSLDGSAPDVLVPLRADGSGGTAVLCPPFRRDRPPACTVHREQAVDSGALVERLRLTANVGHEVTVRVGLTAAADFADVFALRGDHTFGTPGAERSARLLADGVAFGYRREDWRAGTTVTAQPPPESVTPVDAADGRPADGGAAHRLEWTVTLPPHGSARIDLRVIARPHTGLGSGEPAPSPAAARDRVCAEVDAYVCADPAPAQLTRWPELLRACEQGLADLAGLRVPAAGPDDEPLLPPAAGVPWFLTLFGRDSLLTSLYALPYRPDLAAATLPALAATQAGGADPSRVAQPGKIVHEIRHGELAHFGQVPFGRYYGTVDATPLFLVLLGAYTDHTGDTTTARRLEKHARAAVDWMFRHGGLDERGYLVYEADAGGLANQSWKDSPGSICDADGTPAQGALAVSEVQGYAYDALRRTARLARKVWDDAAWADRLEEAADDLKSRFRRDFWMDAEDFPALALDGSGRRVTALASDAGHLLWSGILGGRDARAVGRRLLEPDFFSGWGVRTLAAGQPAYHPLTYHRGSVWPHDNAVIALGLARHGLHEEGRRLAEGVLAAAERTGWRLPEVLAGHGRDDHPEPVSYPHSCSPQAWAAATPLALLTAVGAAPGT